MLALGIVFNALALVFDGTWVLIADVIRTRFTSARGIRVLRRIGGLTLIGLGGSLLGTTRRL
jgi:threonine/homoserine/homoserine lactone efflux protein